MYYLLSLILLCFSLNFYSLAESKYTITNNGNVTLLAEHNHSKKHYFKNYIIKGYFEVNLGNYSSSDTAVIAEYKDGSVINL